MNSWRRSMRLATFVIGCTTAWIAVARAQTPQPPYALFEYSTVTGSGNTITATNIPVVIGTGPTIYVNLVTQFDVDSSGNLTVSYGFPQVFPAPTPLLVSSFIAGKYVGNGGKDSLIVTGPGVLAGGATAWSISFGAGAPNFLLNGTFYVAPIASSPIAARLTTVDITSTAWSYGFGNGFGCTNGIIGVSQIGNTLTVASFSTCADVNLPRFQMVYTLQPQ
jgi:hypothetical protein